MRRRFKVGIHNVSFRTQRKGVSPLIAAVLLIAFTMAVAAILTAWVTTFTQEQTETVGEQSEQVIECSYATLSVFDATWDNDSEQMQVTVANTGNIDFRNVTVIVLKDAGVAGQGTIDGLETSDVASVPGGINYSRNTAPDTVRVSSPDCPAASVEETNIGTS